MLPNEILSRLILNTCLRYQGQPGEKVHEEIMRSIETAETVMGVLGNAVPNQAVAPNRADLHNSARQTTGVAVPFRSSPPIAPNLGSATLIDVNPKEVPLPEGTIDAGDNPQIPKQYWTTSEIIRRLQDGCPAVLRITPKLVGKPIELIRFIQSPPGGADGFPVRLQYHQRQDEMEGGAKIGPQVHISPDDRTIDCDDLIRQIEELAHGMYTATPRKVEARPPEGGMSIEEADAAIEANSEAGIPHDAADESHLISSEAKITTDRRAWGQYASES